LSSKIKSCSGAKNKTLDPPKSEINRAQKGKKRSDSGEIRGVFWKKEKGIKGMRHNGRYGQSHLNNYLTSQQIFNPVNHAGGALLLLPDDVMASHSPEFQRRAWGEKEKKIAAVGRTARFHV